MKTRIENNGLKDIMVITAEEGKVFRRKGTEDIFGEEIWLGYSHYIGGVKQDPPHLDVPEDFEEIDAPVEEEPEEETEDVEENTI